MREKQKRKNRKGRKMRFSAPFLRAGAGPRTFGPFAYAGTHAPVGHTPAQAAQSVHLDASMV